MNDTVQKLMGMVDLLCSACVDDVVAGDQATPSHESNASTLHAALETELTRLFTPLSDEQIHALAYGAGGIDVPHLMFAREVESLHGIGETK